MPSLESFIDSGVVAAPIAGPTISYANSSKQTPWSSLPDQWLGGVGARSDRQHPRHVGAGREDPMTAAPECVIRCGRRLFPSVAASLIARPQVSSSAPYPPGPYRNEASDPDADERRSDKP